MIISDYLTFGGVLIIILGVLILLYSSRPSERKRQIYLDSPFGGIQDFIVKPFRLFGKGLATFSFTHIAGAQNFRIFLTDLFAGLKVDYTWGPRYFEKTEHGDQIFEVDLGRGEFALVIDNRKREVSGRFSLEFKNQEYPNEKYSAWGLALIEIGASMTLVGIVI